MTDGSLPGDDGASVAARDELAGVVDLFGALTRAELSRALSELAFKRRTEVDDAAIDAAIDAGLSAYYLVAAPADAVDGVDDEALAVGPAAFPSLPPNAEDLPHILDVPDRDVDRDRLAATVLDRLSEDVTDAIDDGDEDRLEALIDVTYDVEAWATTDAAGIRERIVDATE
ncbi:DUF7109 family protein [Halorubrum sp. DTA98]|uniref:DUF7109 family protein n=1 Tax=Halorubrum sp. DTA98 TaxID=3402163 RepID=UPI003AAB1FA5